MSHAPQCPFCHAPMQPGRAAVHGSLLSFLFTGRGYQRLWFNPYSDDPPEAILQSREESDAHRCPDCGTVAILPPAPDQDTRLFR